MIETLNILFSHRFREINGLFSVCSAWLAAYEHPVVDRINQRIEDLTGLDVKTAEELQVRLCV